MKKFYILVFTILAISISSCSNNIPTNDHGKIMVLSLSSDGHYVISTDMSRHVVLWDLKQHTHKIIGSKINIYSAYFIKNTNNFMYQDDTNNEVIIRNTDNKIIKKLQPGFPTYGQVITSDLKTYFASDKNFNIFKINNNTKSKLFGYYCPPDLPKPLPKMDANSIYGCMSFGGAGKLFNLTLANQNNLLIGSSYGYALAWNTKNGKMIRQVQKNIGQTFATISPDNRYIISGGQGAKLIQIDLKNINNITKLNPLYNPATKQDFNKEITYWLPKGDRPNNWIGRTTTIKFIDDNHYLVIFNMGSAFMQGGFHYAGLFKLGKKKAIKYLNLLAPNKPDQPYPTTQDYDRDQAIDTSPTAHILVMAQAHNNGILVYKYNPKSQTLKQIWAPIIKTPWWHIW